MRSGIPGGAQEFRREAQQSPEGKEEGEVECPVPQQG